jgi:NAD(P)H-flavin reductase
MVFLIRPYSGMTSRLRTLCASSSNPQSLRVLVEGPYGATTSPNPLHAFSSLLFITGGTGIAVALSYLNDSIPENVTDVHIVWAVREHAFLSSVLARDIPAHLLKDERLRITVHVTQDAELKDDIVVDEGDGLTTLGSGLDHKNLEYKAGRPDVGGTVQHAAGEVGRGGKLAVVACGPAQMADEARRACVKALGRGYTGVEYFEESFKW